MMVSELQMRKLDDGTVIYALRLTDENRCLRATINTGAGVDGFKLALRLRAHLDNADSIDIEQ